VKYPIVLVEWADAFSLDEEMGIDAKEARQVHTRYSVGYLTERSPQVVLASTMSREGTAMQGTLTIPQGIVVKVTELRKR